MSGGEILLIFLAILVLFGADKMPGMARTIGKGMREFQKAADEIKSEFANSTADIKSEMNNIRSDIQDNVSQAQQTITATRNDFNSTMNDHSVDTSVNKPDESYRIYQEAKSGDVAKSEEPQAKAEADSIKKFPDIGANI